VNEWTAELEDHVSTFTKQAITISNYDRMLIENSDKIFDLSMEVQRLQVAADELDNNLDMIHSQQSQLHIMLEQMESEAEKLKVDGLTQLTSADLERERGYKQAETLNSNLDSMSVTLRDLVSKLNNSQETTADKENPMHQIKKVLNSHLTSLLWIDQTSASLQSKIHELGKLQTQALTQQDRLQASRGYLNTL